MRERAAWRASRVATTRWTATGAGSVSRRRTTCSSTAGASTRSPDAPAAAQAAYRRGETDEFIIPTVVGSEGRIRAGDSVLCFNFRPDRMREIVRALAEPGFGEGDEDLPGWRGRGGASAVRRLATMTEYQHGWPLSGGVPLSARGRHARRGCVPGRRRPAARGRDREVRPRHVLLQRRRGAGAARARVVRWCPRSGTWPPTTSSHR